MLALLENATGPSAKRDLAMLRCMFGLGLRRGELLGLDLVHLNLDEGSAMVLGKDHLERERLSVPPRTLEALKGWLAARGSWPGPLFCALHPGHFGHRLNGSTLFRIIRKLGRAVGVETRPHGVRHTAITKALDATGGNVRSVQKFSRHAKVETVGRYDDARTDLAGEVAILVDLGA
jgi:integrase/recombinase XerC